MEEWRAIKGYENQYEVSNKGRVRSVNRIVGRSTSDMHKKGQIIKPLKNSTGYLRVSLKSNGKIERMFVHRLVAETFIPRPDGKNVINHKDFNPLNNDVENLEWVTQKENMQYSAEYGRLDKTDQWKEKLTVSNLIKTGRPVIATSIDTNKKIFFRGINETRKYGFSPSCVCDCCKHIRKEHKGYVWEYAES